MLLKKTLYRISNYELENSEPEQFAETLDLTSDFNDDFEEETKEPEEQEQEILTPEPEIQEPEIENDIENEPETNNFDDLFAVQEENNNEISEPEVENTVEEEQQEEIPLPAPEPDTIETSEPLENYSGEIENINITEENTEPEIENKIDEINNDTQIEEAANENIMAETSLLDEDDISDDINDDWDISSLGALGEATSMPEYEPEPEIKIEETKQENFTPPVEFETNNNEEEKHEEKIMGIREKLAARKGGKKTSSDNETSSKSSRLMPLLMIALTVVGGLIFWELKQLNDKMTLTMMNMSGGNFESVSGIESTPSYDYSVDFIFDTNLTERMAQRGHDGWQVVGSRRTQDSVTGQLGYEFIFMRKTPGR